MLPSFSCISIYFTIDRHGQNFDLTECQRGRQKGGFNFINNIEIFKHGRTSRLNMALNHGVIICLHNLVCYRTNNLQFTKMRGFQCLYS